MYKIINGWTKEKMKTAIKKHNNGRQARNEADTSCTYLSPNGNRCSVGCFINRPESSDIFKCKGDVIGLLGEWPDLIGEMPLNEYGLTELQIVHDRLSNRGIYIRKILLDWIDQNCEDS